MSTNFTPRPEADLVTLDFDDRRRLALETVVAIAEANDGMLHPAMVGPAVLGNVVAEDEVLTMGDHVAAGLNARFAH